MLSADPPDGAGYTIVERFDGANRFETARLVAADGRSCSAGAERPSSCPGATYADALAVSPVAFARKMPVLLTEPDTLSPDAAPRSRRSARRTSSSPARQAAVARSSRTPRTSVLAGNDAGRRATAVERWEGADRYATAVRASRSTRSSLGWAR